MPTIKVNITKLVQKGLKNCGIGSGGFQPGNQCARGGGGIAADDLSDDPDFVPEVRKTLSVKEAEAMDSWVRAEHFVGGSSIDSNPDFQSALSKLPGVAVPIHRGVAMSIEDIKSMVPGKVITSPHSESWTKNSGFATDWAERHAEGLKPVVFTLPYTERAKDLGDFNPLQKEVIWPKGSKAKVQMVLDQGSYVSVTLMEWDEG